MPLTPPPPSFKWSESKTLLRPAIGEELECSVAIKGRGSGLLVVDPAFHAGIANDGRTCLVAGVGKGPIPISAVMPGTRWNLGPCHKPKNTLLDAR